MHLGKLIEVADVVTNFSPAISETPIVLVITECVPKAKRNVGAIYCLVGALQNLDISELCRGWVLQKTSSGTLPGSLGEQSIIDSQNAVKYCCSAQWRRRYVVETGSTK